MNTTFEVSLSVALWLGLLAGYLALVTLVRPAVLANYHLWVKRGARDDDQISWDREWIRVWGQRAGEWRASGLKVMWPSLGIWPGFYRWVRSEKKLLAGRITLPWWEREVVTVRRLDERGEKPDQWITGWQVRDRRRYLLTTDHEWRWWRDWTPTMKVWWVAGWILIALFVLRFAWTKISDLRAAPAPTPAPTAIAAPTATPEPEVETTYEGDALVVDLDRDVPPSEFWRRVNEALNATCKFCPPISTIPIPDWVWDIVGDWEFTVVRLPEGMDGYIVAYQTSYGMAVQRVDDSFQPVGHAEALAETEATIAARDRRFGIGYNNDGWDLPIDGSRGNALVTVTESSNIPLIIEARGFVYNYRWWHWLVGGALLLAIVFAVYRRLTY